jgi:predicted DNA-binding WGR domain protein
MARTLLSKEYGELIDPSQNADKFYLVCVWQDAATFIGEAYWGRRGSEGTSTGYYNSPSRSLADAAVNKKFNEKLAKGYRRSTIPADLTRMLTRRGLVTPSATPSATPPASQARTYVSVPAPSVITTLTARDAAVWEQALADPDYVPSQSIDLADSSIVRVYAVFSGNGVKLLAFEPDPAKTGAFRADLLRLALQARMLFAKVDSRKPLYSDTILDCWTSLGSVPVLVIADVLRLDGRDVRSQPYSVRQMLVEQVLGEFEMAGQSTSGWKLLATLPREQKRSSRGPQLWLRRLSAPYDSATPNALLRRV